jgi:UMP-CMP kinase
VFVLGGPGSGKGTQCAHIVSDFGFVHLSAGDLLREEQQRGGETAEMIQQLIAEGKIVPVAVTLSLLRAAMEAHMSAGRRLFLIDGFPRNQENLDGWQQAMAGFAEVEFCLFLECPEEELEARLLKRGESSGRIDDNLESIQKRFITYKQATQPVIQAFAQQGKVREVSSQPPQQEVRQTIGDIFRQVQW